MSRLSCAVVGLLCALLLGTAQAAGMAGPPATQQIGAGLPPPADRELAIAPSPVAQRAESILGASAGPAALLPAGKLAFQSLRDGNWEIYVADADGRNPRRVTNRDAADVQPRLNKGCSRLVFSTNASGNYEIATINPDGTGLVRLTRNDAVDNQPAWSPDGTRIAFQSYRDAQSEIYVMGADGSSPTRLTYDAAFDGYPTWSPDGQRIAFSSTRSGSQAIWAMNADGSSPVQLSGQRSSVYPAWSPDGSRLAFSADADYDGFLELWIMKADGSEQRMVYDPGWGSFDAWARGWSPDGRWVSFTRLHLVSYQGAWYWDEAVMLAYDSLLGGDPVELATSGLDWHPQWQALDAVPPVATLDSLPAYSRSWRVPVSWFGRDEGADASGVIDYDLQFQANGDAWSDWLAHTPATRALYAGTPGHYVNFRIRGWDAVYNYGSWTPSDMAPGTRLFSFYLTGQVHDVRGFGLSGATVTIAPEPVTQAGVDARGAFAARLALPESTQVSAKAVAFASPPATLGQVGHDLEAGFCLAPGDDAVSNGGFEAGGGSLNGWAMGGEIPARAAISARHSGQAGALLGPGDDPQLSAAQPLPMECIQHDLVGSPDGTLHMICQMVVAGQNYDAVHYSYRSPGGAWSAPIPIGNDGLFYNPRSAVLALDGDGRLHAVWAGEAGIYYNQANIGGTWGTPGLIGPNGLVPAMAADSRGGLHVVYWWWDSPSATSHLFETYRPPGGKWSSPVRMGGGHDPVLAAGQDGVVHFLWMARGDPNTAHYRQWTPEAGWEAEELVGPCGYYGVHSLVEDRQGRVHALWTTTPPDSLYSVRSRDGTWTTPQILSGVGTGADLAVDSKDTLYVVYRGSHEWVEGIYFLFKHDGQDWASPVLLEAINMNSAIAVDAAGNPHIVYQTMEGDRYRTGFLSPADASSSLQQTITIPPAENNPTLSLFYKLWGVFPAHEGGLRVAIDDGASSTVVLTTTTRGDWTHAWAPLDAWAGQTVQLTLAAESKAGEPYARLAVDEVTAGSWLTPVPLAVTPAQVPGGVATAITVTGQNFRPGAAIWLGGALLPNTQWADEASLTATVPKDQRPGKLALWVVNPDGARGPAIWLRVGEAAFLPIVVR
jgi:hypothetical protein